MNELIPIGSQTLAGCAMQTVNARDLHSFLEVGKDFSNWIKDRIKKYGFQDGVARQHKARNIQQLRK